MSTWTWRGRRRGEHPLRRGAPKHVDRLDVQRFESLCISAELHDQLHALAAVSRHGQSASSILDRAIVRALNQATSRPPVRTGSPRAHRWREGELCHRCGMRRYWQSGGWIYGESEADARVERPSCRWAA